MRIQELNINDFGIFQNEKIENLRNNLIIIGGHNRSGKTTFMNILKNINYGFTKGTNLPPFQFNYDVSCKIKDERNENLYGIKLEGYKNPEITTLVSKNSNKLIKSNEELYGNIDKFTYNQLFTISLDELRNIPKNDKISTVLLGAGYKEVFFIPKISKELEREFKRIGGTQGRNTVGLFKPYYNEIKEGINLKKEASKEINCYYEKIEKLKCIEEDINNKKDNLVKVNKDLSKLDIIKDNFECFKEMEKVELELQLDENYTEVDDLYLNNILNLKENYMEVLEQYENLSYNFKSLSKNDNEYKDRLLENKEKVCDICFSLPVVYEKMSNIELQKDKYKNEYKKYLNNMRSINEQWHTFEDINYINCDKVSMEKMMVYEIEMDKLINTKNSLIKELEEIYYRENSIRRQVKAIYIENEINKIKKYFIMCFFILILGISLAFIDKFLALIISIGGFTGLVIYFSYKKSIKSKGIEVKENLERELENILVKKDILKNSSEKANKKMNTLHKRINEVKHNLKLPENVSYKKVKDYLMWANNFKNDIAELKNLENEIYIEEEELKIQVSDYKEDICYISNCENNTRDLKESIYFLKKQCEIIQEDLKLAEKLSNIEYKKYNIENEMKELLNEKGIKEHNYSKVSINNIINKIKKGNYINKLNDTSKRLKEKLFQMFKSERIKKIFDMNDINEKSIKKIFEEYNSQNGVEKECNILLKNEKELEDSINNLISEREKLKYEIKDLSSSEKLENAQKKIDKAKSNMEVLARKYAIYSCSNFLLNKIYKNYIEKSKEHFLNKSGEIFRKITSNEYTDIMLEENFLDMEFKTTEKETNSEKYWQALSRGTKEQLFLSLRIARIKSINPSLPVIFDDCFVNFDVNHISMTIDVISELIKTHQVFILTCHSELIDIISNKIKGASYFKLDKGKFSSTNSKELYNYLKSDV